MSSRASPGGSSALRTRCTRRSLLVTVPSRLAPARRRRKARRRPARRSSSGRCPARSDASSLREQRDRVLLVGLGLRRILADDVERVEFAAFHRVEHFGEVPARARAAASTSHARSNFARLAGSSTSLAARKLVGKRAHVAAALHVVLSAQRIRPRAVAADVTGEQREVDQRADVVDGVVMLGDAERPAELRARGLGVGVRQLGDELARERRSSSRAYSSVYGSTHLRDSSRSPLVARSMNARFSKPAARISRPTALASAMSEPTSSPSQPSAHCAREPVRRGSTTYSFAPL